MYSIAAEDLSWETEGGWERSMGAEHAHVAVCDHPELGQITWTLWEYPVGAENHWQVDVGDHELVENIEYSLDRSSERFEDLDAMEDETDNPPDMTPEDRRHRIDVLVSWFLERFEDPVERTPYETAEGGFQWIWGGPFYAVEVLSDRFPDEDETIVRDAADEIESNGPVQWAPKPDQEYHATYDPPADRDAPDVVTADPDTLITRIDRIVEDLPEPNLDPVFTLGDDGLIHLAPTPPDSIACAPEDDLLAELQSVSQSLCGSLEGTNAYPDLLEAARGYHDSVLSETLSISRVYARGIRLDNAGAAVQRDVDTGDLPPLPSDSLQHLASLQELHATYVMDDPAGRRLVEAAADFRRSPEELERLRSAASELAGAVSNARELFGKDVPRHVAGAVADIGQGPRPERSTQRGEAVLGNLMAGLFKGIARVGGTAILADAIVYSQTGSTLTTELATFIDHACAFVTAHLPAIQAFAGAASSDLGWLGQLTHLLGGVGLQRRF